jgi:HTH-type transcriptional regulator/antitoxin MqsA
VPYVYKGEKTRLPAIEADYCDACGEAVMDRAAGDRYGALVQAFQKQVNAGLVDPAYIARVRMKLRLGKKEAAEIFGGGVNAFSRYESGKSRPPVALVKLLKVLDHHPELLAEVRA